jgi:ABC-type glycerol-3-phosphate transport system substrate-binding protein
MHRKLLVLLAVLLVATILSSCKKATEEKKIPMIGPVKIDPHPSTLEGKTVVLRWNGKFNGDNFLNRIAELFTEKIKGVRVIKMWEVDRDTAVISDSLEKSEKITAEIAEQKPDIVISAQAD